MRGTGGNASVVSPRAWSLLPRSGPICTDSGADLARALICLVSVARRGSVATLQKTELGRCCYGWRWTAVAAPLERFRRTSQRRCLPFATESVRRSRRLSDGDWR